MFLSKKICFTATGPRCGELYFRMRTENCQNQTANDDEQLMTIRVAKQFGLVYAPLWWRKIDFLQIGLKSVVDLGPWPWGSYGINELDAAFMGIPPYLIGWDKGLPAKIAAGYCVIPVSLVTYDENINTLEDFKAEHKIALPSPGSIQHILLSMALEKQLGDPNALDDNLVALPHPDGAQAMLAKKDVVAHFTTPPYLFEELEQPATKLSSTALMPLARILTLTWHLVTESYHDVQP